MGRFSVARQTAFWFTMCAISVSLHGCGRHGASPPLLPNAPNIAEQKHAAAAVYTSGSTSVAITPNYHTGFGPVYWYVPAQYSSYQPSSPAPGAGATLNAGSVDFGSVQQGQDYLYRYAVQLDVSAATGIAVYGAATTDLTSAVGTLPVATHLFWLPTVIGTSRYGPDLNNTYSSAATPFVLSSAGATNATKIYSSTSGAAKLTYDYILRLGSSDPISSYGTNVAYTVVAQ